MTIADLVTQFSLPMHIFLNTCICALVPKYCQLNRLFLIIYLKENYYSFVEDRKFDINLPDCNENLKPGKTAFKETFSMYF